MKTRNEIEAYLKDLGVEIKSTLENRESTEYGKDVINTERYMPITGEKIIEDNIKHHQIKVLNKEATNALLNLITQSITSGDMETAKTALEVLQEESGFYKGHENAAISNSIPLDKRIQFEEYCQQKNNSKKEFTGSLAAFMASAQNIAESRRTGDVNKITNEINKEVNEKENNQEFEKE